jgi:Flp pilus assembly protein TadD
LQQYPDNVALHLARIKALGRLDRLEEIENTYRRLIAAYPGNDVFYFRLAAFYLDNFRQADAEALFRTRVQQFPHDIEKFKDLLRFRYEVAGVEAATAELERAIAESAGRTDYQFLLAELLERSGDANGSAEVWRRIARDAQFVGDRHRAITLWASQLWLTGDRPKAAELAESVLAEDPKNEQALILKSSWLLQERDFGTAIALLRTALRGSPDSAEALLLLARAHELSGADNLADDAYTRALTASEDDADIGVAYTRFLIQRGRPERAAAVLEKVLSKSPADRESLVLMAQVRIASGDWQGAQDIADRLREIGKSDSVSEQIMGAIYAGQKRYQESVAAFEHAYRSSSQGMQPMILLVRAYVIAGQHARADSFLDAVLTVNPDNRVARLLQGQLYASQGDTNKAAAVFRELVNRDASTVTAWRYLASTELSRSGAQQAIVVLDEGLSANAESFDLRLMKALLLERMGDFEAAISEYEVLLSMRPQADVVANNLASALSDHRTDQASLQRALDVARRFRNSDVPQFKDTLGWTHYRLGAAKDAIELIAEAAESVPFEPVFRYHLGMSYAALEDSEAALRELEKALELAGDEEFRYRKEVEGAIQDL